MILSSAESTLFSALFVEVSRKKIASKTPQILLLHYCSACEPINDSHDTLLAPSLRQRLIVVFCFYRVFFITNAAL